MSVRHALLALLSEGPKYGLQLRHEFEERTGEVWPLNVGQVYTTLQRLERDGLVESDDDAAEGEEYPLARPPAGLFRRVVRLGFGNVPPGAVGRLWNRRRRRRFVCFARIHASCFSPH